MAEQMPLVAMFSALIMAKIPFPKVLLTIVSLA